MTCSTLWHLEEPSGGHSTWKGISGWIGPFVYRPSWKLTMVFVGTLVDAGHRCE